MEIENVAAIHSSVNACEIVGVLTGVVLFCSPRNKIHQDRRVEDGCQFGLVNSDCEGWGKTSEIFHP